MVGNRSPRDEPAYTRGLAYLESIRSLALSPDLIYVPENLAERLRLATWVATSIHTINTCLQGYVEQCHQCFHPGERRMVQVFAAPITEAFKIDGCCNLQRIPAAIVLDVGRVHPSDWLGLVVHEYAHVQAGHPGHHVAYVKALTHLCLGLHLPVPPPDAPEAYLQQWPHCPAMPNPLDFWLGNMSFNEQD